MGGTFLSRSYYDVECPLVKKTKLVAKLGHSKSQLDRLNLPFSDVQ